VTFDLDACRFQLAARRVIQFPPGMAGNVLRGALGKGLRKVESADDYARIFEPTGGEPTGGGPSGLSNRPRPFVIRSASLNGRVIQPGEGFCFQVHLFDTRQPSLDLVTSAFLQWADVLSVEREPIAVDLNVPNKAVSRIRVEFQTPTELKGATGARTVEFPLLLARIRDRVSTLRSLYGGGPLEIDFRELSRRAGLVNMARSELRRVSVERRSSQTGQHHSIGGLVGFAEYEGDLAEFVPYLEAAAWTGVGRHCTWGNGQIEARILES
jgi:CRISPR-associated endoribonuclease Cas6